MKDVIKSQPWGFWQALGISFLAYFLSIVGAASASLIFENSSIGETEKTFAVYAASTGMLLAVAMVFIKLKKISWRNFFKLPKGNALFLIPFYYLVYLFITVIVQAIFSLMPGYNPDQEQQLGFSATQGLSLLFVFIALVILPPMGEEVIFRGILYPGFKTKFSKIIAALLSSVLFGLAHMQWNVGLDTFVLSLVIVYAIEKHKSLWMAIGIHGVKNLIAFMAIFIFNA